MFYLLLYVNAMLFSPVNAPGNLQLTIITICIISFGSILLVTITSNYFFVVIVNDNIIIDEIGKKLIWISYS